MAVNAYMLVKLWKVFEHSLYIKPLAQPLGHMLLYGPMILLEQFRILLLFTLPLVHNLFVLLGMPKSLKQKSTIQIWHRNKLFCDIHIQLSKMRVRFASD